MANNNLTIWQKMTGIFGLQGQASQPKSRNFQIDPQEILRTTSREEFEQKKLEYQQTQHIQDKWAKIDSSLYNQSVYYEPNRISMCYDIESMEFMPELACALDIYAEESTSIGEQGKILTINSESKRVKDTLTDLFENTLDINTNLTLWARNLAKYGDNFVFLKIDQQNGIIGAQQLPYIEIERREGAPSQFKTVTSPGEVNTKELMFTWKAKNMDFQSFEIAHFRLLGDDRKLPYGTSMLDKVRRIWKQLMLMEDAMLIYRISRAPERRVFKIFVGNMDDKDVDAYVQRVANKFKRDPVVDPKTGQVDLRYNQMSVDQDIFVPTRDINQNSPIETLAGATNLSEIADIEYIQKKMVAALHIPKAYLGFEEAVGEGKSLAIMDIRFARTINRIQKALVQELNKIALVHLYLLGFEDELHNFSLGLTNPSLQTDLLRIEQFQAKIQLYKDATSDQSQVGILPVSHTFAKKNILGMSDSEIILDLEQQRMERAVGAELMQTPQIIKRTTIFNDIDAKYGIPEEERAKIQTQPTDMSGGMDMGGGFSGGGGMDLGGTGLEGATTPEVQPLQEPTAGGVPQTPAEAPQGQLAESYKRKLFGLKYEENFDMDSFMNFSNAQKDISNLNNEIDEMLND